MVVRVRCKLDFGIARASWAVLPGVGLKPCVEVANELAAMWRLGADGELANLGGQLCADIVDGTLALRSCEVAGAKWHFTDGNQLQISESQSCLAAAGPAGVRNAASLASATASSSAGSLHGEILHCKWQARAVSN